jgi:F-type H+-transporting ATPase subunit a
MPAILQNTIKSILTLVMICFIGITQMQAQHDEHATSPSTNYNADAVVGDPADTEAAAHGHGKEGIDIKEIVFGHTGDTHDWHLFGDVSVSLPVILWNNGQLHTFMSSNFHHGTQPHNGFKMEKGIKENIVALDGSPVYDFSFTKNVLCLVIGCILLIWIMLAAGKRSAKNGATKAPNGIQNAVEPIVTFIRDNVAKPYLGAKYAGYMPLLLTFFFFIWIFNLLGLLPFGFNVTGNIAVTAFLALVYFVVMLVKANKYFWGHIFNPPGVPLGVKFILVPIEFLSIFIKPVSLALRLFANIFAGHTIIICIISLIFIFAQKFGSGAGWGFSVVSVAFSVFMFFLELLVAAIQAFIFTNLSAVFIGQAIEEHHHDDHAPAAAH